MKASIIALAAGASTAWAADHTVHVGQGGLVYSPNTVTAAQGDTVNFVFSSLEHTVVQGDKSNPCQPHSGGFFSGVQKSTTFSIKVTDSNPIFFYCSLPSHCQSGMVGVINGNANDQSSYAKAAANTGSSSAPPGKGPIGGTLGNGSGGGSGGGSSKPPASKPASSPAASGGSSAASGATTAAGTGATSPAAGGSSAAGGATSPAAGGSTPTGSAAAGGSTATSSASLSYGSAAHNEAVNVGLIAALFGAAALL